LSAPYQAVRASDGYFTIGAFTDKHWRAGAEAFGHPEWASDGRFASGPDRLANRLELLELIEGVTIEAPVSVWLERLLAAGVPAGPVSDYASALKDPQTAAREMVVEADHPQAGRTKMLGIPVKLSGTPGAVRRPPPTLGQHTREVLAELGYVDDEVDELIAEGILRG
jgi:formyl-CoA transferase